VQDGPTGQYAYVIKEDNVERRPVEVAAVQDGRRDPQGLSPAIGSCRGQYRPTNGAR